MRLHLGKGDFDGEQLLPAALISELHAPRIYNTTPGLGSSGKRIMAWASDRTAIAVTGWFFTAAAGSGWGTLMTLVPDFGIGVAVFTNRSPSEVPTTLTWYIIDRLRGRDPVGWRERFRKQREESVAHFQVDKDARAKAHHKDTNPAYELADYAGDYEHPAYGVMSIKERRGALDWSWCGMFATMVHHHYETFELPEVLERLLPDKLAVTFLTNRDGNIVSLSAPLEPMVKDIEFIRLAAGDCTLPAFRERCVGSFKGGATTHRVTLDTQGRLVLKPDNQPAYRLAPQNGRRFHIMELEGFVCRISRRRDDHRRTDLSSTEWHVLRQARRRIEPVPHSGACIICAWFTRDNSGADADRHRQDVAASSRHLIPLTKALPSGLARDVQRGADHRPAHPASAKTIDRFLELIALALHRLLDGPQPLQQAFGRQFLYRGRF